jgi:hypothetical protein
MRSRCLGRPDATTNAVPLSISGLDTRNNPPVHQASNEADAQGNTRPAIGDRRHAPRTASARRPAARKPGENARGYSG